jgi:hypothetical protein
MNFASMPLSETLKGNAWKPVSRHFIFIQDFLAAGQQKNAIEGESA